MQGNLGGTEPKRTLFEPQAAGRKHHSFGKIKLRTSVAMSLNSLSVPLNNLPYT